MRDGRSCWIGRSYFARRMRRESRSLQQLLKWTRLSLVMQVTNVHEAKTHFSKLLERVERGAEIIIGRAGKPVAKLVPYTDQPKPVRKLGTMKGKIKIKPG